jgi:hypothetical protein
MAQNKNCVTTSGGSLQYHISTKFVKDFMAYMEKSIYSLMQTRFCHESLWSEMGIFQQPV